MTDTARYVHSDDGLDGSHYQPDAGPMDLAQVRAVPMNWLGWKTTQSIKGVDPTFPGVDAQAEQLGFRWFLPYGWLSSTTDPTVQADHYLAHYGKRRPGKGAMIDAEEAGITVDKCLTWLERVEDELKRPCSVYTGLYVAGGTIWRSPDIRQSKYGPRPMHLAAYITAQGLLVRLQSLGLTDLPIHMWQWSSNGVLTDGRQLPGITGRADLNTVVSPSMMDLACGLTAPSPTPEDIVITEADIFKDADNPGDKFVLVDAGYFRPVSAVELGYRGIALTVELGKPCTKADRDTMAALIPAAGAIDIGARDAVAQLGTQLGKLDQEVGALKSDLTMAGSRPG